MVVSRKRRASHLGREDEMLGEPDGLVAQFLGFEGRVEKEVGIESTEGDAEFQYPVLPVGCRSRVVRAAGSRRSRSQETALFVGGSECDPGGKLKWV